MRGRTFRPWFRCFLLCLCVASLNIAYGPSASVSFAQVTSSGLGTSVTPNGNVFEITNGLRAGNNVFHSFGEFSLSAAQTARFQTTTLVPDLTLNNIIGRVTGGNPSSIFGTIDSAGYFPSANLFLMNPAGILFGSTATLNVGGTAHFTTADYLRLTDGNLFRATPNPMSDALLSSAPVAAFGFLGSNPASIQVQGSNLTLAGEKGLTLIGGNISITADPDTGAPAVITAPSGRIDLVSVTSPGEMFYPSLLTGPNIEGQLFTAKGTVSINGGSLLSVDGSPTEGDGRGGTIRIRAGELVMDNLSFLSAVTTGDVAGEAISVSIEADGLVDFRNLSGIQSGTLGTGRPGDVEITAQNISLSGGGLIFSFSAGETRAGNIRIHASKSIMLTGAFDEGTVSTVSVQDTSNGEGGSISITGTSLAVRDRATLSTSSADGRAGNISVEVNSVEVTGGGVIASTTASGSTGRVTITASDSVVISGSSELGDISRVQSLSETAPADILIQTGRLTLADGAIIEGKTAAGPGGTVRVISTEAVTVTGGAEILSTTSAGSGASLEISSPSITSNRGTISTRNSGAESGTTGGMLTLHATDGDLRISNDSLIASTAFAASDGGPITIIARDSVLLSGNSQIESNSFGSGTAGPITISASQRVSLTGSESRISSEARANGNGSTILLKTPTLDISGGARITSSSVQSGFLGAPPPTGNAGSVTVQGATGAADSIRITDTGSGIFTETQGTGNGGNITARANELRLTDGATISSKTTSSGNAGDILVKTNDLHMSGGSTITAASTGSGNAGTITIQGANSPANSVLIEGTGTGIFTNTDDRGKGGDIAIDTRTLTMQNGGTISAATSGTGEAATGGNIRITVSESVDMRSNASISSRSTGDADAGNISINAGNRFDARNSSVTTRSEHAGGGNIEINALDQIRLVNSQVNASAFMNGGNISIDPNLVILQNSSILAQAIQGNGGNITIFTPLFLADSSSLVSASSQFGLNGTVTIQNPTSNLSGSLGTLATKPRQAQSLLTQRCAALANGQASSFVVAGREQLPADPGGWLTSPLALAGLDADPFSEGTVAEGTSNLAPRTSGLLANGTVSLRRFTPAGFLMANYADSEATGCHS